MTIRVDGLDELSRDLGAAASSAFINVARGKASRVVNDVARDMAQRIDAQWSKGYATGATKRSITPKMAKLSKDVGRSTVTGFVFMEGGGVIEYEFPNSRGASPVGGPAARAKQQAYADAVADAAEEFLT